MSEPLVKVSVSDVRTAVPSTPGVEAGLVVLTEERDPNRSVQIVIGQPEARAIQSAWLGATQRRPSTWDLFIAAIDALGGRVERVVVTAVEEGVHFYADVEIDGGGERKVLSARPSDAIALALRSPEAGIYLAEKVLVDLGLAPTPPLDN